MSRQPSFTIASNQPLIGILFQEHGKEIIRYFSEEKQADEAVSEDVCFWELRTAPLVTQKEPHFAHELCEMLLEMTPPTTVFSCSEMACTAKLLRDTSVTFSRKVVPFLWSCKWAPGGAL